VRAAARGAVGHGATCWSPLADLPWVVFNTGALDEKSNSNEGLAVARQCGGRCDLCGTAVVAQAAADAAMPLWITDCP